MNMLVSEPERVNAVLSRKCLVNLSVITELSPSQLRSDRAR